MTVLGSFWKMLGHLVIPVFCQVFTEPAGTGTLKSLWLGSIRHFLLMESGEQQFSCCFLQLQITILTHPTFPEGLLSSSSCISGAFWGEGGKFPSPGRSTLFQQKVTFGSNPYACRAVAKQAGLGKELVSDTACLWQAAVLGPPRQRSLQSEDKNSVKLASVGS